MLDDLVVGGSALYPGGGHGPLATCGRIVIEPGGRVTSRAVQAAEGVEIHGNVTANLSCQGSVFIGAGSTFRGTCKAGSLVVEEGAIVQGEFAVGRAREG
jgi:cytoskeletal protein CcmA (bactofilin family)